MIEIKHQKTKEIIKVDEFWLRDHCQCGICYNVDTKQRSYNLLDLPAKVKVQESELSKDGTIYKVKWSDGHESSYDTDVIYRSQVEQLIKRRSQSTSKTPWNRMNALQNERHMRVTLGHLVSSDDAVKQLVGSLVRYGIAFVDEVPPNTTMTEAAVRRVFPIMRTFFGEMFTFSDAPDHADTAFSKSYLGSHTDNTYFCDAAGLQVLHCIEHRNGSGGESFFVDGLHAALELKRRYPSAFDMLTRVQVPAEYIEEGMHYKYSAPMICTDPVTGEITQLRLNVYDRAMFDTLPQSQMQEFYDCFRKFLAIVQSEENVWQFKLHPGTVVIFDNWRLYHGRCAYTGFRKMTGCYVYRTDFMSTARVLGFID